MIGAKGVFNTAMPNPPKRFNTPCHPNLRLHTRLPGTNRTNRLLRKPDISSVTDMALAKN